MELFTYRDTGTAPSKAEAPLAGRRAIIQPNMSKRGWPCNAGSRALENYSALEDATVLSRLEEAGARIVGMSRMSELGFGLEGDTTLQALAAKEADIALVTDTMGEARVAAARAGAFGFKPSWGVVPRSGLIGLVPSMESWGIAAGDLRDIAAVMKAVAGKDGRDFSMPDEKMPDFSHPVKPERCRAVVIREMLAFLTAEQRAIFYGKLDGLKRAGLEITEAAFPEFDLFRAAHQVIAAVEASSSAGKYDGVRYGHRSEGAKNWNDMYLDSRGEAFGMRVKSFLFQGAYFQFDNYGAFENACRLRGFLVRKMAGLFQDFDVLVSPTCAPAEKKAVAAGVGGVYDDFLLTLPANLTGHPALQVPDPAAERKDLGLQFIARRLDDARLLALGAELNSAKEAA